MKESSAKLKVAVCDQVVFIKIIGKGDFNLSIDLKTLFQELRQRGYRRFVVEAGDCTMMDSTFLGTLSDFALKLSPANSPQSVPMELINPAPRVIETMETLGMVHLFKVIHCSDAPSAGVNYQPLEQSPEKSKTEVARHCWESHITLMGLNPENVQKFKDVAQFLAEDLKRLELAEKK